MAKKIDESKQETEEAPKQETSKKKGKYIVTVPQGQPDYEGSIVIRDKAHNVKCKNGKIEIDAPELVAHFERLKGYIVTQS